MMNTARKLSPLLPILLSVCSGCGSRSSTQDSLDSVLARTPPSPKEVVRLLLRLRDVPLRVHESCATAGTGRSDVDLGDYISGWLVELKQGTALNWIEASATPAVIAEKQPGWRCVVMFRHVNGDDRWGWGVSFLVRGSDRQPLQGSVRCLGGG